MTETLTQSPSPVAAVVTEHTWAKPVRSIVRRRHPVDTPPETRLVAHREAHLLDTCPRIADGTVVAHDVALDSRDAGWPCETCAHSVFGGSPVVAAEFSRHQARTLDAPTDAQIRFARTLYAEKVSTEDGAWDAFVEALGDKFTKRNLSTVIDGLKSAPRPDASPAPSDTAVSGLTVQDRPNRYSGECPRCHAHVAEGAGLLGKLNGRWVAVHRTGECPAPAPAETPAAPEATGYAAEAKKGDVHVVDGRYYRIHVAQRSGKPYAVKAIIEREAERDDDGNLVRPGEVSWEFERGLLSRLSRDTMATADQAAAFGNLVGRCCFCSTKIDTPESTIAGYGPTCAAKYGLPWGSTTQTTTA